MNAVATASNFRTTRGNKRLPINMSAGQSLEDQMIAKETISIAVARLQIVGRKRRADKTAFEKVLAATKAAEDEAERLATLRKDLIARANNPDTCTCHGKRGCHLHIHSSENGRLLTRGEEIHCIKC